MKKHFFFFIITVLISYIFTGHIIPDKQNPFIIESPTTRTDYSKFNFNFQLPSNTKGLLYGQYIAVRFPYSDGKITNLGYQSFQFTKELTTCQLFKATNTEIKTKFVPSISTEENVCYCKLIDTDNTNVLLPLQSGIDYRLIITIQKQQKPYAIFYRNFDLFTTTSNRETGIKIDTGNGFGSGPIYDSVTGVTDLLKIEKISKIDASLSEDSSNIYQYQTFIQYK